MNKPVARYLQDSYSFWWQDECMVIELDGLHEARGGELRALLTVMTTRNGAKALLHQGDFNLNATRTRQEVVRALSNRVATEEFDWGGALEQVCFHSRARWREGDPVIDLRTFEPPTRTGFLLNPYLGFDGPTTIFAMGGTGKSLFGLALGLTVASGVDVVCGLPAQTGPVLYLDWETEAATHRQRLAALCTGAGVALRDAPVYYRRIYASLAESVTQIRRTIAEQHITLVIVDSLGAARGGEPESADSTIRLFNAARSFGVPWLAIDHMTKNGGSDQSTPFGSVYTHNMSRMTWALEPVEDGGAGSVIALNNRKANNSRPLGRRAYQMEFRTGADDVLECVSYTPRDLKDIPALAAKMNGYDQIALVLERNRQPMTAADIATALQASGSSMTADKVGMYLSKYKRLFVPLGEKRWGLLAKDEGER